MADELSLSLGGNREIAALLFIASSTNAMDVYSALNSSPWTSENFGADPEKAASCREYVRHAIAISTFYGVAAGIIGRSWYPIAGMTIANLYMYWLYERALDRGNASGSSNWEKS